MKKTSKLLINQLKIKNKNVQKRIKIHKDLINKSMKKIKDLKIKELYFSLIPMKILTKIPNVEHKAIIKLNNSRIHF